MSGNFESIIDDQKAGRKYAGKRKSNNGQKSKTNKANNRNTV